MDTGLKARRVRWLGCAAVAAQLTFLGLSQVAMAAIPVEESVEESAARAALQAPRQGLSASDVQAQDAGIPPTIEPAAQPGQSEPRPLSGSAPVSRAAGGASGGQLSDLFYQMQILQNELQELRGLVEEQGYQISRMQRDQKEQYIDLDRRVMALSQGQPAPGPTTSPTTSSRSASRPAASGGAVTGSERDAYTRAFDAMRARDFDSSLQGFQSLVENYPNGQYTPNAYYWIGELELVAGTDPEQARQAFMQVITLYPDHQKAPDAMYKLGVVYHNLGDKGQALQYLQQVQREYPGSSAAGLAAKYASELQ